MNLIKKQILTRTGWTGTGFGSVDSVVGSTVERLVGSFLGRESMIRGSGSRSGLYTGEDSGTGLALMFDSAELFLYIFL